MNVAAHLSDDPLAEAVRLVDLAQARGMPLRILGGVAFQLKCPSLERPAGSGRDVDLVTLREHRRGVAELLTAEGYAPDKHYNALNGHRQMYFVDPSRGRPVDVIVDSLAMCHTLGLRDRLGLDYPTVPLADLLLSKLQIVELNQKDIADALALLREFPLEAGDAQAVSTKRIMHITSQNWGWWRTVTGNLEALSALAEESDTGQDAAVARLDGLRRAIDDAPKSGRWRVRARIGHRVRWFQTPEEIDHD